MPYDKKTFLKEVVILHDTREQKNGHILDTLDALGVRHQLTGNLLADYSFMAQGRDFSLSCVVERKANVEELYNNLTQDRGRIEKEFAAGSAIANQFMLFVENCTGMDDMRAYRVTDEDMRRYGRKVQDIGRVCYATLQSWQCENRYKFKTVFVPDQAQTAAKMLEQFYWYWRNFKLLTAPRRSRKGTV